MSKASKGKPMFGLAHGGGKLTGKDAHLAGTVRRVLTQQHVRLYDALSVRQPDPFLQLCAWAPAADLAFATAVRFQRQRIVRRPQDGAGLG